MYEGGGECKREVGDEWAGGGGEGSGGRRRGGREREEEVGEGKIGEKGREGKEEILPVLRWEDGDNRVGVGGGVGGG